MKRGSIYEQTFFTDRAPGDESHLLNWYEPVGEEQLGWILRQAEKEGLVDKFESEKKFRGFRGDFRQFITDEGQSAESVYEQLSESGLAHSDDKYRDTSEFLARAGIDGVKYPVNTMSGAPKDGDGVRFNYVSFRDDNIRVDHKWTDGLRRYSVSRNPDARREVEDALAKDADGRYTGRANADIVFSDALPPALIACGIPDGRVYTRGYVLRKLEREHALDADGIMAVSQAMESPAAVLSDAAGGGYIVLTDHETRDENGRAAPVMVYLRPDGRGNYIASAYAKTENGERQFTNLINSGNLLFANRERVAGLSLTGEVKSSFESARTGDAGSIPYGGTDSQGGEPRHSVRRDELALHDDPQREYDEVVARYTNPDGTRKPGWMEAPNGEPTNLTERQWVQVRTPAFKRWFGDWEGDPANASKVVDENGEPLVVYHGTETGGFSVFNGLKNNSSSFGLEGATFFSTSLETAKTYTSSPKAGDFSPFLADAKKWLAKFGAKTQACWFDSHEWHVVDTDKEIKPPKRRIRVEYQVVTENGTFVPNSDGATVAESIRKAERSVANALMSGEGAMVYSCFIRARNPYVVDFKGKTWRGDVVSGTTLDVARKAIEEGADCAIIKNVEDSASFLSDDNISDSIAVFSPEQIKSATENTGAFDASDPDIRHSVTRVPQEGVGRNDAVASINLLKGRTFTNRETGIAARLSSTGAGKLISNKAVAKSVANGFTPAQHNALAAQIDRLYEGAILVEERPDRGGDVNIRSIRRFLHPVRIGEAEAGAYITVKESVEHGNRIYSVEGIRIAALPPTVRRAIADHNSADSAAYADTIAYLGPSAQVPDADAFVRDAVMGMLAAAGDGKGAANAGGACQTAGRQNHLPRGACSPPVPRLGRVGAREVSRVRSSTGHHRKSCSVCNQ